ncbi:MAG TPA: hypothetical protein VGI81_03630 [Tepidisphaeraceae bacterium]|jgi:hypothetical protein
MLYEQTKSYIGSLSDAQLTEYLQVGTDAYEADAVSFAREEYRRRALDLRILSDAMDAEAARDAARTASASQPLDRYEKVATFLKGMVAVLKPWTLLLPHPANVFGEHRRNRERRRYRLAGFASVIVLIVVYVAVRRMSGRSP